MNKAVESSSSSSGRSVSHLNVEVGGKGRKGQMMGFQSPVLPPAMILLVILIVAICTVGTTTGAAIESETGSFGAVVGGSRSPPALFLSKRSFSDIQCKGSFDKNIFSQLERVCDDCFNLYQETSLYTLCRSNCFGSSYFKGCLDALLLDEEEERYDEMIEILGKK